MTGTEIEVQRVVNGLVSLELDQPPSITGSSLGDA
jgi:hypothetical protein